MANRLIIVNEVLCFCVNARETMNRDSIQMVLSGFFTTDELLNAKKCITDIDYIVKLMETSESRLNVKRKAPNLAEKISKDLVAILDLIDEFNSPSIPLFVASDIRRLPPIGDQNTNMAAIHSAIIMLRNNINLINESIAPLLDKSSVNHVQINNLLDNTSDNISSDKQVNPTVNNDLNKNLTYASIVNSKTSDDGFRLVNPKKPKKDKDRSSLSTTRKKQDIYVGKGSSEALGKTPGRRCHLFLSRINIDVTTDVLKTYICNEFKISDNDCQVENINTRQKFVSSFKVSLMIDSVQDAYDGNRWPKGIIIKRFFIRNNNNATNNSSYASNASASTLNQ